MLRKRRSKRHAKCSIKRYSKHSKTRIRRNMYRKKHKKTQRGGMFGLTSDKTQKELEITASRLQEELLACREELATSKNLHKKSHAHYTNEIELREIFYKNQIQKLEVDLRVNRQRLHDVQIDLTSKLDTMKRDYDACMDKYDSNTVKYNEAKTRMILKMKPDADITNRGYNSDWDTFDTFGKNKDVEKIVRSYMQHNDLDTAVQEYRDMPERGSRFYGEYGEHNPTYGNPS